MCVTKKRPTSRLYFLLCPPASDIDIIQKVHISVGNFWGNVHHNVAASSTADCLQKIGVIFTHIKNPECGHYATSMLFG